MKKYKILIPLLAAFMITGCHGNANTEDVTDTNASNKAAIEETSEKDTAVDLFDGFDPFEHLTMVYEGIAPYGTAYYEIDDNAFWKSGVRVVLDKVVGLSNGDIITVHIIYPDKRDITKEYTVDGLDDLATYQE